MSELVAARADFELRDTAVADVGCVGVANHLALVTPETIPPGLTSVEIAALASISQGNTAVQAARELDLTKSEIEESRDDAMAKFATRSIAVATDQSIRRGIIAVKVRPEISVIEGLTKADYQMLRLYAKGISNHRVAKETRVSVKSMEGYHDRFLERIGAWSRPHAIRRGHELGVLR